MTKKNPFKDNLLGDNLKTLASIIAKLSVPGTYCRGHFSIMDGRLVEHIGVDFTLRASGSKLDDGQQAAVIEVLKRHIEDMVPEEDPGRG